MKGLELVRGGTVGNVISARFHRTGKAPRRPDKRPPYPLDGDPFREVGVHALYLMAAVLGSIRDASYMFRSTGYQTDFKNDEWFVQLECEKGLAQIQLTWNGPDEQTLEIYGDEGRLKIDLTSGLVLRRRLRNGKNRSGPHSLDSAAAELRWILPFMVRLPKSVVRFQRRLQSA